MGSGFLAAAVVLVVLAWRIWQTETTWRDAAPTLVWCAVLSAVGWATRVEVPWHAKLKATGAHDFLFSIVHSLEWPLRDDRDWAAAVLWLPWALVAWHVLKSRATPSTARSFRAAQTIVALGGWVLVQVLATAYARGAGADYPASRYMDTLAFGAAVNAIALAWLFAAGFRRRTSAALHSVATLAWLFTLGMGLREVTERNLRYELPDAKKYYLGAEGHMRCYLATNDPKALAYPDIPFPSADGLIERLAHPALRAMMPVPIRAPLELRPATANSVFVENDARAADLEHLPHTGISPATTPLDAAKTWGSFGAGEVGARTTGVWRSAPVQATRGGWLKFETAGFLGEPNGGVLLELRDAATDAFLTKVRPTKIPGDTWRSAYVRAPRQPFVVVAHDRHAARWFAFSGPVEMSTLSYWAWRVTKNGLLIVWVAGAATIALLFVTWSLSRTSAIPPARPN
jgi:hypothetical protein